ncbi:MAG TPA: amino acid permease [Pyrinomonadaceae bacterium]|nr:amino acid permease [Pyrinomonadaceae bacterium]
MKTTDLFRKKSIAQIQADVAQGMSDHEQAEVGGGGGSLRRTLGLSDLTLMGIAAIIGAGIFAMVGKASYNGGPAVIFLFIFTAIACAFSALCYAEFASRIPVAGSAYTYSYASLGELVAWIIGWDLIVEYAIGNIAIAISWSDYFTGLLKGYGINFPLHFSMDFLTAKRGFAAVGEAMKDGATIETLRAGCEKAGAAVNCGQIDAYTAWAGAPKIGGLSIVADLPALLITFAITALVYVGIRESKLAASAMTVLKIGIILLVIFLGAFYVVPANWSPFAPNGIRGVMMGVSAVFFAYIGFDALSTTAEECKNPRRDLPRAMIYSLVICTVLYIALALVLTGMVSYTKLNVGDPLAFVFGAEGANIPWVAGIIAISAVIALATVFLVFQIGQPRLWMAMSRDGLLPQIFSSIHPRFKTPWFATLVTGLVVAIPALFMNLTEVTDLASIGTLFAFLVVCAGVLFKDKEFGREDRFVPYVDSQIFVPVVFAVIMTLLFVYNDDAMVNFFTDFSPTAAGETRVDAFLHKLPYFVFLVFAFVMTYLSVAKRLTLIPVLGVLSCAYLMSELGITNWTRFAVWLLIGLAIYFGYGYIHSHLARDADDRATVSTNLLKLAAIGFLLAAIGLSVSSFSFINDFILYLVPSLQKSVLRTIELILLLFGLLMGVYGAVSQAKVRKTQ